MIRVLTFFLVIHCSATNVRIQLCGQLLISDELMQFISIGIYFTAAYVNACYFLVIFLNGGILKFFFISLRPDTDSFKYYIIPTL